MLELLNRARTYPYDAPIDDYLFDHGGIASTEVDLAGRVPVLAIGSNGSPEQLKRKFGADGGPIPLTRALVRDHVVVYSAHFTSYGSLPAMLHPYPGASAYMFVTWLDQQQLERMHDTEIRAANYRYEESPDIDVFVHGKALEKVGVYVGTRGPLTIQKGTMQKKPIRLMEIASICPSLPKLTQRAVLRCVHRSLSPKDPIETFIERVVNDQGYRAEMNTKLSALS